MWKHQFKRTSQSARRWFLRKEFWTKIFIVACIGFLFVTGSVLLWVATLKIPDLNSLESKILAGSTKIYDKTGNVLLYDLNQNVKREVVPFDQISPNLKEATLAIEDDQFYTHSGVRPMAFMRAVLVNLTSGEFRQGGSTITQQVIKNSLLTTDKKISRKIKEWVLALKLERSMSKDDILNLYLNGSAYGGTYYGVEEASKNYFATSSKNVTIAQAAYIAAITKAPTYYSPYGSHKDQLDNRKNLVLSQMRKNNFITEEEYTTAKAEKVEFKAQENKGIKAPHFVMYIREYITEKYGEDVVKNNNLRVVTTLDYELQKKAEEIVKKYALQNVKNFNAENAALVAIDPTTGQILTMVGSRDYFDKEIQGNFNVAVAHRQPGSAFKPFAYATAFTKGYTPDTILFDLPTQFSSTCDANGTPLSPGANCYTPQNYDNAFRGPMSIRNALAQSINIPAIKALYLAGMRDTLQTAQDMGITSLTDINRYGLTMVLGGGEVSPLEMTSAYGVFSQNGVKNPHTGILKVTDKDGNVLEEFKSNPTQVIPEQSALLINDILRDNDARTPLYGSGSAADFSDREVALKTGTTNDSRDAWIIGYTPNIVVGAWAGNNDNTPMVKKTSGLIVAPLWRAVIDEALKTLPETTFKRPEPYEDNLKPILRGEMPGGDAHSILYWVNKDDPKGDQPRNPSDDPQFELWETPIRAWSQAGGQIPSSGGQNNQPTGPVPLIAISNPQSNTSFSRDDHMTVDISYQSQDSIEKVEFYVNNDHVKTERRQPFSTSFDLEDVDGLQENNELRVIIFTSKNAKAETKITFKIRNP